MPKLILAFQPLGEEKSVIGGWRAIGNARTNCPILCDPKLVRNSYVGVSVGKSKIKC